MSKRLKSDMTIYTWGGELQHIEIEHKRGALPAAKCWEFANRAYHSSLGSFTFLTNGIGCELLEGEDAPKLTKKIFNEVLKKIKGALGEYCKKGVSIEHIHFCSRNSRGADEHGAEGIILLSLVNGDAFDEPGKFVELTEEDDGLQWMRDDFRRGQIALTEEECNMIGVGLHEFDSKM